MNVTTANQVAVTAQAATIAPPAGFVYVDGQTFKIATAAATDPATDVTKVDYIFTEAVKAAADVSQGTIGKLDPATNTFTVEGLGEFEFEVEENEWSLTVADVNGEWAAFIPAAAVGAQAAAAPAADAAAAAAAAQAAQVAGTRGGKAGRARKAGKAAGAGRGDDDENDDNDD